MPALSPDDWSAQFTATHGREPTLAEYRAAVEVGDVAEHTATRPRDESLQQMSAGARQMASGAREFLENRVVPAAAGATAAARTQGSRAAADSGMPAWRFWSALALPVLALLTILSMHLPAATVPYFGTMSFSEIHAFKTEYEDGGVSEATLLLIGLLLAIAFGVAAAFVRRTWIRITAGILTILVGLFTLIDASTALSSLSGSGAGSVSIGLPLMCLLGLLLLAAGVIAPLPRKKPASAPASTQEPRDPAAV